MNRTYNSKSFLQKKKRAKKIKVWLFSILGLVFIIGFVYWMRHPSLNVEKVKIVKNSFSKTESIEASVLSSLEGNEFLVIPKTNAFLLPRNEAEEKLKTDFPEIEKIDIDLKGLKEIEIEIFEYEPKIILYNESNRYFVNKEGDIYLEEPILHSYDNLISIEKDGDFYIGDNILNPEFLEKLNIFVDRLRDLDIKVKKVRNPEEDVYRLETGRSFEIVISSVDDLNVAYENVSTILEDGALSKEDLDLIDYIDLRFGNKVFYKLKE